MYLAKNIRFLRKKNNYSQDFIAEKLGYKSYTTVQKWEMGVSEPSLSKLKELSDIFNVDMNDMTTIDIEADRDNTEAHLDPNVNYAQQLKNLGVTDSDFEKIIAIYKMMKETK